LKNPSEQYLAFMNSRSVQDALIDRFNLVERYESKFKQDARLALQANARASSGKDGLITVEVTDKDPLFAAQLANAHIDELQNLLSRLAVTEAQQRRVFFEKQLNTAKENLVTAERALKASGVNSSALKANPQAAVEGLAKLKATLTAQEVKLASMRGYLTESAPDFKQAQIELSALRTQVARFEKADPDSGGNQSDYIAKFRDFKYNETLFELFAKQYEIARVDESREGAVIQVVDVAEPPEKKTNPKKAIIALMAAVFTGFFLLLLVFVRHALRSAKAANDDTSQKIDKLKSAFAKALGR
jgi:uncharacterized protein involved in exopolysaccharide biosynthesis